MDHTNTKTCWAGVTIYGTEETVPKRLAPENGNVLKDGVWAPDVPGRFYLTPGKLLRDRVLWYELQGRWFQAEWTGQMWEIPEEAAEGHTTCQTPLCSAKVRIAFAEKGEQPRPDQERILVFHYLKDRKEQPYAKQ